MKVKKLISAILACVMVMTISAPQAFAAEKPQNINQAGQTEAFFDDFSGDALDTGKWLVAEKCGAVGMAALFLKTSLYLTVR